MYRLVFFVSLLFLGWATIALGQSEKPPMREITTDEITRFINKPYEVKIDGYLEIVRKGDRVKVRDFFIDDVNFLTTTAKLVEDEVTATENILYLRDAKLSGKDVRRLILAALRWKVDKIEVEFCIIDGELNLWGVEFTKPISFEGTTFSEGVDFEFATFAESVDFDITTFSQSVSFFSATFLGASSSGRTSPTEISLGGISFDSATFSDVVWFSSATFKEKANFARVTFSGHANFSPGIFLAGANFYRATFKNGATLGASKFSGGSFSEATFSGDCNFYMATLSGVAFDLVSFLGKIDFDHADFKGVSFKAANFAGEISFQYCKFNDSSDFRWCFYPENAQIDFSGATGFAQMLNEWEYDPQFDSDKLWEVDELIEYIGNNRERRGLKGHFEYDETFYVALIQNYQGMGWLSQADDAYYTYRVERRKRRPNRLHGLAELVLLELPFGYGVKPLILLRSFLALWIPFSWFYVFCLRHRDEGTSPWRLFPLDRHKFAGFTWAFLHSFSILTPGLDLDSFAAPYLEKSPYRFNTKSSWVYYIQVTQRLLGWYLLALLFILFGKIWIR